MQFSRRIVLGFGCAALISGVAAGLPAFAQDAASYPNKPVKMVVPYTPGGFPDVTARIVAAQLQELTGQPFVVENVPGAGGIAASETVLGAAADGYTLLVADNQQWAITPNVYKTVPYDMAKDFAPISLLATTPIYLAVNSKLGVSDYKSFVELMKAKPGDQSYGTPGIASAHHFLMETLKVKAGIDMEHIPYKGGSQVAPALASGEVMVAATAYSNIAPFLEQGSVKVLATSTPKRSDKLPDVPTFGELGLEGLEFTGSLGLVAPGATPKDIVEKLSKLAAEAIKSPAATDRLSGAGFQPVGSTPEEMAKFMADDLALFKTAVETAKIEKQ